MNKRNLRKSTPSPKLQDDIGCGNQPIIQWQELYFEKLANGDVTELPEEELFDAFEYEYSRESFFLAQKATWQDRGRESWEGTWNRSESPPSTDEEKFMRHFSNFFPKTPWLAIPRIHRLKWCTKWQLGEPPPLSSTPMSAEVPWLSYVRVRDKWVSTHHLDICWSYSDDMLVEAFRGWVAEKRTQIASNSSPPVGRATQASSIRVALKALGAFRLLEATGASSRAFAHTKQLGLLIYSEDPAKWSGAKARVLKTLGHWPDPKLTIRSRLADVELTPTERQGLNLMLKLSSAREIRRLLPVPLGTLVWKVRNDIANII